MLAMAVPLHAAQGRDQSYITYDDGGTIVKQADDGREVDARVNYPVYPGDEVTTNRRGRAEIRLADGNIIALDRSTSVRFRSIADSYDDSATQTIVELVYGHVIVQRTDYQREALRLDTASASYIATDQAIYAVDNDSRSADRVSVFYGEIEVRTPARTANMREGEEGRVDDQGLYGLVSSQRGTADEFERWFIRRSERYGRDTSQYLDRSLAYSDYDLQQYGTWSYVSSLGSWGWRPYVGASWRPYYAGNWVYGPNGCLVWVSTEPWGWVPYHYGRWAFDPGFGWVWLPGYAYSPAWVYWIYGPGYFGWAPAGWYDCYRPYYGWAYQPYARAGLHFGFGFYGRVRVNEIDLRPWTFVNADRIVSTRVDQAALTTDAIRQRLQRDPGRNFAFVSGQPARFSRSEIKDPAAAINTIARRGIGSGTGREGSGSATDMTPFFRRDPALSSAIRERIVRSAVVAPAPAAGSGVVPSRGTWPAGSGVPSPGTPGTIEGRIPPHGDSPDSGGSVIPRDRTRDNPAPGATTPQSPAAVPRGDRNWRDRLDRSGASPSPSAPVDRAPAERPSTDWRGRAAGRRDTTPVQRDASPVPRNDAPVDRGLVERKPVDRTPVDRGSDIPRRIIDRIGGARIYGGDVPRDSAPRREASPPPQRDSAPRDSAPRERSASPPPPQPSHESAPPPSRSNDGGHIKRDH